MGVRLKKYRHRFQVVVGALLLGYGLVVISMPFFSGPFFSVSMTLFACLFFVLAGVVFFKWDSLLQPMKWGLSLLGLKVLVSFVMLLVHSILMLNVQGNVVLSIWDSIVLFIVKIFKFPFYTPQLKRAVIDGREVMYIESHYIYLERMLDFIWVFALGVALYFVLKYLKSNLKGFGKRCL